MIKIDANKLKEYIISNNKISEILTDLGCHNIKEYHTEYRCGLPERNNKTAVCVKKETLSTIIRTSNKSASGDIFTLVMEIKNISFGEVNRYLHKLLGLKYEHSYKKKSKEKDDKFDPLYVFRKHLRSRCVVNQDVPIYDENELKEYTSLPHLSWIRDGIMPFACERFNIGYSYDKRRIVIPERFWSGGDNDYIGVAGRTVVPNYDLFDIPKYTKLSPTYYKSLNVYGLNENYKSIQEAGYCVVFEAQKSVLKRYSRKDETGVAIGSHILSSEQVKIIIGLNVDVVIAYDKDIPLQHIKNECEKFYRIRNVHYIYDKWELMKEKESPADLPDKLYQFLFKHRVKYDDKERKC